MRWFHKDYWQYLFESSSLANFWCRLTKHPGVVWYRYGLEPDMRCTRCGEDLG